MPLTSLQLHLQYSLQSSSTMSADIHSFYTTETSQHVKSHQDLMDGFIFHYSNSTEAKAPTAISPQLAPSRNSIALNHTNTPLPTIILPLSPPAGYAAKGQLATAYPQKHNLLKQSIDRLKLEYYRYEVTLGVYTMTFCEKCVMNGFVMIVLGLMIWGIFLYFPSLIYNKLSRLDWLLTGRDVTSSNATLPLSNPLIRSQQHCFTERLYWGGFFWNFFLCGTIVIYRLWNVFPVTWPWK